MYLLYTLPETNKVHLEMDGWKTSFLLERSSFRGDLLVSFGEGNWPVCKDMTYFLSKLNWCIGWKETA